MKKRLLAILMMCIIGAMPVNVYAADSETEYVDSSIEEKRKTEIVLSEETQTSELEQSLQSITNINEIDESQLSEIAIITEKQLDENTTQLIFQAKDPSTTTKFRSGNIEKEYDIIALAFRNDPYSMAGNKDNGDIAIYGKMSYSQYTYSSPGVYVEASIIKSLSVKAYNLRESDPHNLRAASVAGGERLDADGYSCGVGQELGNEIFKANPSMGTLYTKSDLGYNYYVATGSFGLLESVFLVSYYHGNSEYTIALSLTYGEGF